MKLESIIFFNMWKNDIFEIVTNNFSITINEYSEDDKRSVLVGSDFMMYFSVLENMLILEDIIIPKKFRNKGLLSKTIDEIIDYCKYNFDAFRIAAIVSNKINNFCIKRGMIYSECTLFNFDKSLYDYDGEFGNRTIYFKKEAF